ncbi:peptide ABC transporter substrate-binding protein [Salmonella enterica subsp. enterica serovar Typhimurium]|nr:peptide ABC transporter substrate-binding protein [Salmonella enterica subsp. enterica serovar Typhimurium]
MPKLREYNPQKSREQLKALGIENLTLHLWVPTSSQAWNPSPLKTAELIQADMAQVGVKVVIVPVEGRFQEARLMDMNHDLTLSGWATDSNDPDSFFRPLLSCAAINSQTNFAHWCNPEFDSVLRKALSSQQLASRIEAYEEAQNILEKELPILPLASSLRLQAYRYDIKGLVLSPFGNASFAGVSREKPRRGEKTMIIFTLRRLLLLLVTLFFLTFIGFSLSYFTPHAPLQGASLWNAWVFWFNGLLHWDFGVSSINGQPDLRTA